MINPGGFLLIWCDDDSSQGLLHTNFKLSSTGENLIFVKEDGETIIDSSHAMTLESRPESMVIIGSGAIGMEFAYIYNAFGTNVIVIEMLDRIVPLAQRVPMLLPDTIVLFAVKRFAE